MARRNVGTSVGLVISAANTLPPASSKPTGSAGGGAVGIVGADVVTLMATHFLETSPDVGLDVLHQMTEVDGAISIRQGAGNEDFASLVCHRNPLYLG